MEGKESPIRLPKRVKMGEWTKPFFNNAGSPPEYSVPGEGFETKIIPINFQGNPLSLQLDSSGFGEIPQVCVVTPDGERVTTGSEAERWGSSLFSISMLYTGERPFVGELPRVSLQTPSGEVYTSQVVFDGEEVYMDREEWEKEGDKDDGRKYYLLIPDDNSVLSNIQMRFDSLEKAK